MDKITIRERADGFHVEHIGIFKSLREAINATNGWYVFIPYYKDYRSH